ncbi:MAG TPA: hypothetical protein VIK66_03990 [Gaiellaceae bacterium]|jgi:hypothetical protein
MRRRALILLLGFVAATPAAAAATTIRVTITASHTVKANAKWPVVVRVSTASGKPLAGTLTNNILLGGIPVGKVDNGKVWRFRGSWQEPKGQEITWPAAGKGQTFGFQTVVRVNGQKVKKTFLVTVR